MQDGKPESQPKPKRVVTIDFDTGEILEATPVLPRIVLKHFKRDYFIMFQETVISMAMDKTWKLEETRIFLFVLGKTAMGNWLHMGQKEIGEQLGINKANVCRAFKSLVARGCMEMTNVVLGKSKAYRVHPDYAWKGAGAAYTKEITQRRKEKGANLLKLVKGEKENPA